MEADSRQTRSQLPRVLVVGCGSIGGVVAASLHGTVAPFGLNGREGASQVRGDLQASRTGELCVLSIASTNDAVRAAWTARGPSVDGSAPLGPLPPKQVLRDASESGHVFDVVFVAVQPPQIDEVARSLEGRLNHDARVVCLPNGLCEDRLATILGSQRVVGAVVAWGARMLEPGIYTRTSTGGFRLGTLDGQRDDGCDRVAALLQATGPVDWTDNLRGARFTKLALNCAVSTLGTIGGSTLGELLVKSEVRELALEILREAVLVARAEGIALERVTKLDLDWLVPQDAEADTRVRALAQHAMLLAVGARYRRLRSSMLAAIERGRMPSVDHLNGEIVRRGKRLGVATPANEAALRIVWDIAAGRRAAGAMAIRRVRDLSKLLEARA